MNSAAPASRSPRAFRSLRDRVVVVTGASSGIGRATARAFAAQGARLVLTARNADALQSTARECAWRGAHSLVVPADVSDATSMAELARKAMDAFGRIDVWINNAGSGLFGPFVNADITAQRRVVETNLLGAMNGAAAVLPWFLQQGHGTLITNISLGGFAPVPFAAAYTASKFGLRGFMAALRQELAATPRIHLCSVFPAIIDTPGFQHAGNVSGVQLKPARPIFAPEDVAAAMVSLARRPRAELCVGWTSRAAKVSYGVAPGFTEALIGWIFRRYVRRGEPMDPRSGNLAEPSQGIMTAHGGWNRPASATAQRRRRRQLAWAGAAAAGSAAVARWWFTRRSRSHTRPRVGV
jgi:short-subunit dehydrogenase